MGVSMYAAYGRRIVDGVLDYAEPHGHWEFHPCREPETLDEEMFRGIDGILIELRTPAHRRLVRNSNVPAVAVTGVYQPGSVPTVIADNRAVGAMAGEYFLSLGFEHIAYMGVGEAVYIAQRREGLRRRLRDAPAELHVFDPDTWRSVQTDPLHAWLTELPKPVAVLAAEDSNAVGVANACRDLGISVPEQAAILGVDNDERFCRMATPPLSSIDHGAKRIGSTAAKLLDDLMDGAPPPGEPLLIEPTEICARQSTDTLAITHPDVAKAVKYIREHACEGIDVPEVTRATRTPRRTLEAAFRRTLRRTILQEINRVRLAQAKSLLVQTDLPMPEICERAGFSYPSRLTYVIKKHTGLTPSEYRRRYRAPAERGG